jgi:molybdopterin synthase catalytic subunit
MTWWRFSPQSPEADVFELVETPLPAAEMFLERVSAPHAGGFVHFEGRVRDHNEGKRVTRLEYEAYAGLARREGECIVAEARSRFDLVHAHATHRLGALEIGERAVVVSVAAAHRDDAFGACRFIIDAIKGRVPIWKKEWYVDGTSAWVGCPQCPAHR